MVIGRILGIFCMMFIGFGANKIGWLPAESGRYLSRIVLNIAAPCVVVSAMASQDIAGGRLHDIALLIGLGAVQYAVIVALSFPLARLLRPSVEDRGIYRNFFVFSNNGFMGFPVTLAIFGHMGMFYMVVLNSLFNVLIFTLGIWNAKRGIKEGQGNAGRARGAAALASVLKDVVNPVIIALFVGFFLLFMHIRLPETVAWALDSVGAMMSPLSMIVIGLQLTESKFGEVVRDRRLVAMSLIRLIGLGALCFAILLPFLNAGFISPLLAGLLTLNLLLPCAAVPVMFVEEYGGNVRLAAEGTFLSTLLSVITVPIASVLLSML